MADRALGTRAHRMYRMNLLTAAAVSQTRICVLCQLFFGLNPTFSDRIRQKRSTAAILLAIEIIATAARGRDAAAPAARTWLARSP
jgi:hypothetical protein